MSDESIRSLLWDKYKDSTEDVRMRIFYVILLLMSPSGSIKDFLDATHEAATTALEKESTPAIDIPVDIQNKQGIKQICYIILENTDLFENPLMFASYFIVKHPDISLVDELTEADKEDLFDLIQRFKKFVENSEWAGKVTDLNALDAIGAFATAEDAGQAVAKSIRVKETDFPIDKLNGTIWGLLEKAMKQDKDGQISVFPIQVQKAGAKTPIVVQYAISFDDLEKNTPGLTFTRKLTPYEKRIYIAAGALWNAKQHQPFTYSELYAAAGYVGRPGGNDTDKIDAALTKMNGAKIYVDNVEESGAYNYPHFRYDGSLLPLERVSIVENGKAVDAAIHLFREPPLISYAREHKQITTISVKLLQSPLSKTDANILLEDYFLDRIARAKNERNKWEKRRCRTQKDRDEKAKALEKNVRILLNTLYEKTGINTLKQRQRAPEKIKKLLDHYKAEKFISEYSIDSTAITIVLT